MWKWIVVLFLVLLLSHCYRVESFRGGYGSGGGQRGGYGGHRGGHRGGYGGYGIDSGWGWWPFDWWPVIWYDYE